MKTDDDVFWDMVREEEEWEPPLLHEEIVFWLGLAVLVPTSIAVWAFVFRWLL